MNDQMRIEFEWLDRETGSEMDRAFFASIGLAVGGEYLTRIEDLVAKTVCNHMRGCAWRLATWFAANWWRLRWEPAPDGWTKDADWRLAHSMAASGGGYVWPNMVFTSDCDYIEIAMSPDAKRVAFEPIHYINHVHARITAAEFEQKVDEFMESVLSRLQSFGLQDKRLPHLWAEVLAERHDSSATQRRKLEAMAGFDPDAAPDELLKQLLEDDEQLGKNALAEVAAETRHATGQALKVIRDLGRSRKKPNPGGFRASMPAWPAPQSVSNDGDQPWQRAGSLARHARKHWDLGNKPIRNSALAKLLDTEACIFTDDSTVETHMPLGLRTEKSGTLDIYFDRPSSTTRRFAVSRLLGDYLYFANQERLIPATHAKTSRQKFQRAFAQEFLCPIDALLEKIQTTQPDEDDISEAATHFHVSPLMVRTTLVNHGKLEREALTWTD
ncbi:MAG: hypothetical protein HY360_03840 [Verrucomicrobia bacterium]|nr:hypothetical protein [Verrucomicrobiota bacterium]